MLDEIAPNLWTTCAPLRFLGVELGSRMTVVRRPDGELVLHSPVRLEPELARAVADLGTVKHILAPNKFHHLFVGDWQQAFPDAKVYAAPGIAAKRPDLKIDATLVEEASAPWADVLEHTLLDGIPATSEAVFFHRASRTLIATDLAFNIGPESPLATRIAFRLGGAYGRLSPTLLERVLVRDRPAFARSLRRVMQWPFERVVVAHGRVSTSGGREELADGFSWVLNRKPSARLADG